MGTLNNDVNNPRLSFLFRIYFGICILFTGAFTGCTFSSEPEPPPAPPFHALGTDTGWKLASGEASPPFVRDGVLKLRPEGKILRMKLIHDFGVEDTRRLSYLLVHFGEVEGRVFLNWKLRGWDTKRTTELVLGQFGAGPVLLDLSAFTIPEGRFSHELGLRLRGKRADVTHVEWLRSAGAAKELAPRPCRYLVFETKPGGPWKVKLGDREQSGTEGTRQVWPVTQPARAVLSGEAALFAWAGCPPVDTSPSSAGN